MSGSQNQSSDTSYCPGGFSKREGKLGFFKVVQKIIHLIKLPCGDIAVVKLVKSEDRNKN